MKTSKSSTCALAGACVALVVAVSGAGCKKAATPMPQPQATTVTAFYGMNPLVQEREIPHSQCDAAPQALNDNAYPSQEDAALALMVRHCKLNDTDDGHALFFLDDPRTPTLNGQLVEAAVDLSNLNLDGPRLEGYIGAFGKKYGPLTQLQNTFNHVVASTVRSCAKGGTCISGTAVLWYPYVFPNRLNAALFVNSAEDAALRLVRGAEEATAAKERAAGAAALQ